MKNGLTLMEESFCQLVALGKTGVEAWAEAFGRPLVNDRDRRKATKAASYLQKRPDILARIAEAAGEQKRRDRAKWEGRGEDLAERIYRRVLEADHAGDLLTRDALKGVEALAKLKGLNAPDETVLKDGGRAEDFTPRGVEAMSDEDLKRIVEAHTVDVDSTEERA